MLEYLKQVLDNIPDAWLALTTHRLDIYDEKLAKVQFVDQFDALFKTGISNTKALEALPTAYDYIRLGHPLSSILEWAVGTALDLNADNVISFSSRMAPILAILRKNLLDDRHSTIYFRGNVPSYFDADLLRDVYGYNFDVKDSASLDVKADSSTILVSQSDALHTFDLSSGFDFYVNIAERLGSILVVNGAQNMHYISEIQHVRRRETIAMTPADALTVLQQMAGAAVAKDVTSLSAVHKVSVLNSIAAITGEDTPALVGSSGLSIQYAIMMGLIHHAQENHKGKPIKFIVPPNCYGGTNDQARRVAACLDNVEIVDLPVDGEHDMVQSIDSILSDIAQQDAIPYIIAEIPTNPRVEVPDLHELKNVLSTPRVTPDGTPATDPVFILDQTFCPNVNFFGEGSVLSTTRAISYASGSKFPSGGLCTAGYCVANKKAKGLMDKIGVHLQLCDNEATELQYSILAMQLPTMVQRIAGAYRNTREFVRFIQMHMPQAKINFVSEELAAQGFTPSVFSLDLPAQGHTEEEREAHKRALNLKLINMMITKIPTESKYCVSYGQLKGCYWTIPATSTQGTTKEGDKDYIVRAALSDNMDLQLHQKVFLEFANSI